MRQRNRIYPPNCIVCDLNPSRFLAFREKQRVVEAEYGFRLCVPRRTPEQQDGYRRYMSDYRRRYQEAHKEKRKAYRHAYWVNVTKRGFDSLAEANGDEETLKRRAAKKAEKQRLAAYEARKKDIHDKYGFWLNTPPKTPEEKAGRERYRREWGKAYKEAHREQYKAQRKERSKREKVRREQRYQEKYRALKAADPAKAEAMRRKHETLCLIQNMTHEERVRYRQQMLFDRLKARAEREEARKTARKEKPQPRKPLTKAEKAAKERERRARREEVRKQALKEKQRLAREKLERERTEKMQRREALIEAERTAEAAFAAEREANRAAYLAAKAAKKDEKAAGESRSRATTEQVVEPPVPPAGSVPEVSPVPVVPSSASVGNEPPKEPPTITTGGEPPEHDAEDEVARREAEFRRKHLAQIRKAAAKKRLATIARKKREAAAQAAREAKVAERAEQAKAREEARLAAREAKRAAKEAEAAAKAERKALLSQACKTFKYKIKAYKRKTEKMRKHLKFPKDEQKWTPEQKAQWNDCLATSRKELDDWLIERMRKELGLSSKSATGKNKKRQPLSDEVIAKREAREKRKQEIFEKYGFTLGKVINTPEEIEGRKRWLKDKEAEERKRNHDKITAYNREYRRRKRAEALAKRQSAWTPEQWAAWQKREATKACPPGSPQWLVKEVVKHLATEQNLPEDKITERLLELGGLDFLIKGAESMGAGRCPGKGAVLAAARALALYLDPDGAEMFKERDGDEG